MIHRQEGGRLRLPAHAELHRGSVEFIQYRKMRGGAGEGGDWEGAPIGPTRPPYSARSPDIRPVCLAAWRRDPRRPRPAASPPAARLPQRPPPRRRPGQARPCWRRPGRARGPAIRRGPRPGRPAGAGSSTRQRGGPFWAFRPAAARSGSRAPGAGPRRRRVGARWKRLAVGVRRRRAAEAEAAAAAARGGARRRLRRAAAPDCQAGPLRPR